MKMQNAVIEFVTFDAQDVVTASGWNGKKVIGLGSLLNEYNKSHGGNDFMRANGDVIATGYETSWFG